MTVVDPATLGYGGARRAGLAVLGTWLFDHMTMLKIRRPQIDALAELARRRFQADARAHLREAHPERWAEADEEVLAAWVERRLASGVRLGLIEEASLLRHLEVASRLDEPFADSDDAVGVLHDLDELRRWPEPLALLTSLHQAMAST
jgi:hypothetical protein